MKIDSMIPVRSTPWRTHPLKATLMVATYDRPRTNA